MQRPVTLIQQGSCCTSFDKEPLYVAVRTRFFDDLIFHSQSNQVVLLASGLDARAYRYPWRPDTEVYELDYSEVLSYKVTLLEKIIPACNHHLIPADLTQPWKEKLLESGYQPDSPSVWLIEGLLMYLLEEQVHALLKTVSDLSLGNSWLGVDLINANGVNYGPYEGYFRFGCDMPEELLFEYGWQAEVFQPGDEGANFGRYTEHYSAREVPDVMRAFLVRAQKTSTPLQR